MCSYWLRTWRPINKTPYVLFYCLSFKIILCMFVLCGYSKAFKFPRFLRLARHNVFTPPARRARRSFKFALFLVFFWCQKSAQRSWVVPLNIVVLSPTFKVNFLAEYLISYQNTHFNTYTTTSKQQEGSRCKDSYPKCFITTGKF